MPDPIVLDCGITNGSLLNEENMATLSEVLSFDDFVSATTLRRKISEMEIAIGSDSPPNTSTFLAIK